MLVSEKLLAYVKNALASGNTPDAILQYLVQSGYSQEDVEQALALAGQQQAAQQQPLRQRIQQPLMQAPRTQSQGLQGYVQSMLEKGYSAQSIAAMLVQQGYDQATVQSALTAAMPAQKLQQSATITHRIHFSPSTVIVLIMVLAAAAGTTYYFTKSPGSPSPATLLDISLAPAERAVLPGERLSYTLELSNLGSRIRYDVLITTTIVNPQNEEVVLRETKTVALETRASHAMSVPIPKDMKPGRYDLRAAATYADQIGRASFTFTVLSESAAVSCSDNVKGPGEEGVDCGGSCEPCASCDDRIRNGDETGIDCGGSCGPCPEESCFDNVQNQGEEGIDCGGPCPLPCPAASCSDRILNQGEEGVDCGGPCARPCVPPPVPGYEDMTDNERISAALDKSATLSQEERVDICRSVERIFDRGRCMRELAELVDNVDVCGLIDSIADRDACYMHFAVEGNYLVCQHVTNTILRQSCNTLAQSALAQQLIEQGREDELAEQLGFTVEED